MDDGSERSSLAHAPGNGSCECGICRLLAGRIVMGQMQGTCSVVVMLLDVQRRSTLSPTQNNTTALGSLPSCLCACLMYFRLTRWDSVWCWWR